VTGPRSHHEAGRLFGTDGVESWHEPGLFDGAEVISRYSRADALADGVLVDVSELASEAGIVYPVAMTRGLWGATVELPRNYRGCQSETGRLWDVVNMTRWAIRAAGTTDRVGVKVKVSGRWVRFNAHCGPGDDAEPVITLMLPGED